MDIFKSSFQVPIPCFPAISVCLCVVFCLSKSVYFLNRMIVSTQDPSVSGGKGETSNQIVELSQTCLEGPLSKSVNLQQTTCCCVKRCYRHLLHKVRGKKCHSRYLFLAGCVPIYTMGCRKSADFSIKGIFLLYPLLNLAILK